MRNPGEVVRVVQREEFQSQGHWGKRENDLEAFMGQVQYALTALDPPLQEAWEENSRLYKEL